MQHVLVRRSIAAGGPNSDCCNIRAGGCFVSLDSTSARFLCNLPEVRSRTECPLVHCESKFLGHWPRNSSLYAPASAALQAARRNLRSIAGVAFCRAPRCFSSLLRNPHIIFFYLDPASAQLPLHATNSDKKPESKEGCGFPDILPFRTMLATT